MAESKEISRQSMSVFTGHIDMPTNGLKTFVIRLLRKRNRRYNNRISPVDNLYELHRHQRPVKKWSSGTTWPKIIKLKYNDMMEFINPSISTYVDVGCGDGCKAIAIAQLIGAAQTVCMDVVDYRSSNKAEFVLSENVRTIVDVAPDFCTLLMVLHHMAFDGFDNHVDRICAFIQALSDSGCQQVLVREHNVTDEESLAAVILSHMTYEAIETNPMRKDDFVTWVDAYASNHEGWYMSQADLIAVFESCGWEVLRVSDHPGSNPEFIYNMLLHRKKEALSDNQN